MENDQMLHYGWLIKSPPLEQTGHRQPSFLKARWRRRWFVLQAGQFQGQYVLNYYTDESLRKLKGTICLDECEQVDVGLTVENGKQRYEHMFDIKTPQRIFYLAADTFEEMSNWAKIVCEACGLRATSEDENTEADAGFSIADLNATHAPRTVATGSSGPVSNPLISSPYIHISTCHSGGLPKHLQTHSSPGGNQIPSPPTNVSGSEMGDDSVFFPSTGENHPPLSPNGLSDRLQNALLPPSRPPKPAHLLNRPIPNANPQALGPVSHGNYANSNDMKVLYQTEMAQAAHNNASSNHKGTATRIRERFMSGPTGSVEANNNYNGEQSKASPSVLRDMKPGRDAFGKSATVDPKRMGGLAALGSNQKSKRSGKSSHSPGPPLGFATLNPNTSFRRAPPVQRALKPPNAVASEMNLMTSGSNHQLHHNNLPHHPAPIHGRSQSTSGTNRFDSSRHHHHHHHNHQNHAHHSQSKTLQRHFNSTADDSSDEASISEEHMDQRFTFDDTFHAPLRPKDDNEEEQIYFYLPSFESQASYGGQKLTMIPAEQYERSPVAYIDLDLPSTDETDSSRLHGDSVSMSGMSRSGFSPQFPMSGDPLQSSSNSTAYKSIDFMKTEAFNRTRHIREEKYALEQEHQAS
ncbi:hypothetical protein TCAL_05829 [Tigriopus californicus]|uniref:PH domain-containing protein n=1 Tax=Tigriopus californicus TaxID=6832 RepID=A0A553P7F8_TIGCA|nr:uncharacterized protein LOC131877384 isoform X2 [Tigriopus californicus]TRY73617.1 hypothetical protein TCAL_05829 [Tigriopus californicus]|eukprot:TCALIF_05829-PA protein Name:"Similar to dos Protein daughter of sevenless (Drosophila melanogaster)" AED:0.03 eAED:0.03 QI:167/1/1/1/0.8/0.83/6/311/634